MGKSDSLANTVVIGFLDGIFTGMFKKKRKRNCLYSYLRAEKFYDKNHYGSNRQYKKLVKRVRKLFKGDNNV